MVEKLLKKSPHIAPFLVDTAMLGEFVCGGKLRECLSVTPLNLGIRQIQRSDDKSPQAILYSKSDIFQIFCLWHYQKKSANSFEWQINVGTFPQENHIESQWDLIALYRKKRVLQTIMEMLFRVRSWLLFNRSTTRDHDQMSCLWIRVQSRMLSVLCLLWIRVVRIEKQCLFLHLCSCILLFMQKVLSSLMRSHHWWFLLCSVHMLNRHEQESRHQFNHQSSYGVQHICLNQLLFCLWMRLDHWDWVTLEEWRVWSFLIRISRSGLRPFAPIYIQWSFSDQICRLLNCLVPFRAPIDHSHLWSNFLHCYVRKRQKVFSYYGSVGSKFATRSSYFCMSKLYRSSYSSSVISQECILCCSFLMSRSMIFVWTSTYALLSSMLSFMRWEICCFISEWESSEILSSFDLVKCFFLNPF